MPDEEKPASAAASSADEMKGRPAPDDPRKPETPLDLRAVNWKYTLKSTLREFGEDQLTDSAAGLTYFAVLSLFPALIALVSILSIFGQGGSTIQTLIDQLVKQGVLPSSATESLTPALASILNQTPAPGLGLALGILAAAWSASNYVKGFGRALNRIYEVQEGRTAVRLNLEMYALTLALLVLMALVVVLIAVSGPVARTIGDLVGLGDTAAAVFDWAKLPFLAFFIVVILALLYNFTPNVRQPKVRWISVGAIVALLIAALASLGLGLYLTLQGNNSYAKTYGALAGVIIFLFWLWVMNTALLFGAELDAELERSRELQGGIEAEEQIQLPPKATTAADKAEAKALADIEEGRRLRLASAGAASGTGAAGASGPTPRTEEDELEALAGGNPTGAHKITKQELGEARKRSREAAKAEAKASREAHQPVDHYRAGS